MLVWVMVRRLVVGGVKVAGGRISRVSPELLALIRRIKAEYLKAGRSPPSCSVLTREIARRVSDDVRFMNEIIRL